MRHVFPLVLAIGLCLLWPHGSQAGVMTLAKRFKSFRRSSSQGDGNSGSRRPLTLNSNNMMMGHTRGHFRWHDNMKNINSMKNINNNNNIVMTPSRVKKNRRKASSRARGTSLTPQSPPPPRGFRPRQSGPKPGRRLQSSPLHSQLGLPQSRLPLTPSTAQRRRRVSGLERILGVAMLQKVASGPASGTRHPANSSPNTPDGPRRLARTVRRRGPAPRALLDRLATAAGGAMSRPRGSLNHSRAAGQAPGLPVEKQEKSRA
ncbi:hypothetical protein CDD82_3585 [Ophiocordyceps australis]|uniref:Uncharacterized protein n=1 Tax=Ophiocordyceps australis TaxID=1399860 RepID=A0A2C5ZBT8_9HYPO|nr:hypothetical protein CDD82_3585 [Ophiocordyceps australis]